MFPGLQNGACQFGLGSNPVPLEDEVSVKFLSAINDLQ